MSSRTGKRPHPQDAGSHATPGAASELPKSGGRRVVLAGETDYWRELFKAIVRSPEHRIGSQQSS